MGYLAELIRVIDEVKLRAAKHAEHLSCHEYATRAALIDPILRALGWDTSNPQRVVIECPVEGGGIVDYALLHGGKVFAVVEAKSLH